MGKQREPESRAPPHRIDALSRKIVSEWGGKVRWNDGAALAIGSCRGATLRGSSTEFVAVGSPASTRAVPFGATRGTPRRLIATSTGASPALTSFTITVSGFRARVAVAKS